jgi:hypothetical protein
MAEPDSLTFFQPADTPPLSPGGPFGRFQKKAPSRPIMYFQAMKIKYDITPPHAIL